MFEKYLKRNEPKDTGGGLGGMGGGLTVSSSNQDVMRGMNRKRSKSRGANLDKSLRLTTEQKCDIAQKELDELKEEIEKYRDNCERVVDNFRVRHSSIKILQYVQFKFFSSLAFVII